MQNWILIIVLGFLSPVWADPILSFPVGVEPRSEVKKEEAELLMQRLTLLFKQDILDHGLQLSWKWEWENPYIGAGSLPPERFFTIVLWGGFVRAPQMTLPALALILCHELGHQLGGPPYMALSTVSKSFISSEGQADFFATQVCWPRLFQSGFLIPRKTSDFSNEFCKGDSSCANSLEAAQDLAQVFHLYFDRFNPAAHIEDQSRESVSRTIDLAYPNDQCRIDTFKAGALCASKLVKCERPRCWWAP